MKLLIYICSICSLLAGCATEPNIMPIQTPNVPQVRTTQEQPILQPVGFPKFVYWAGIETNYSQLQWSTNLVDWNTYPILYYGAPTNTSVTVNTIWPQQFFRMMKYQ